MKQLVVMRGTVPPTLVIEGGGIIPRRASCAALIDGDPAFQRFPVREHDFVQVPPQGAHHGPTLPTYDIHRQGSNLRRRGAVVVVRGVHFHVPAQAGFSAPRTRVHGEDLIVGRIRHRETVA